MVSLTLLPSEMEVSPQIATGKPSGFSKNPHRKTCSKMEGETQPGDSNPDLWLIPKSRWRSLALTETSSSLASTKLMVGREISFFGPAYFQGIYMLVSSFKECNKPLNPRSLDPHKAHMAIAGKGPSLNRKCIDSFMVKFPASHVSFRDFSGHFVIPLKGQQQNCQEHNMFFYNSFSGSTC